MIAGQKPETLQALAEGEFDEQVRQAPAKKSSSNSPLTSKIATT